MRHACASGTPAELVGDDVGSGGEQCQHRDRSGIGRVRKPRPWIRPVHREPADSGPQQFSTAGQFGRQLGVGQDVHRHPLDAGQILLTEPQPTRVGHHAPEINVHSTTLETLLRTPGQKADEREWRIQPFPKGSGVKHGRRGQSA